MGIMSPEYEAAEITPEMLRAGAQAWVDWYERDDCSSENLARSIYLAMRCAAKNPLAARSRCSDGV